MLQQEQLENERSQFKKNEQFDYSGKQQPNIPLMRLKRFVETIREQNEENQVSKVSREFTNEFKLKQMAEAEMRAM